MRKSLVLAIALAALASCRATTEPPATTAPNWTMPVAGAKYLFAIETTDSGTSYNRSTDADIFTVVRSNEIWNGHAQTYYYGWGKSSRQYHVAFEANGDIAYEVNSVDGTIKMDVYPTGTNKLVLPTAESDVNGYHVTKTQTRERVGTSTMSISGKQWDVIKVLDHSVEITSVGGQVINTLTTDIMQYFVPALGTSARTEKDARGIGVSEHTHYNRIQTLSQILQ